MNNSQQQQQQPPPPRRVSNVGSMLLTPQENESLFGFLGKKCVVSGGREGGFVLLAGPDCLGGGGGGGPTNPVGAPGGFAYARPGREAALTSQGRGFRGRRG